MFLWGLLIGGGFAVLALGAAFSTSATNCGGDSAALAKCKILALELKSESEANRFAPYQWSKTAKSEIGNRRLRRWTGTANYLVRTNTASTSRPDTIIVVCDKPFANVPKPALRNLYRKNPDHAVGYLNGSGGLISESDFSRLDRINFVEATLISKPERQQ
jgi:hypothetical protein